MPEKPERLSLRRKTNIGCHLKSLDNYHYIIEIVDVTVGGDL
jgi:hypothetical protein